MARITVEDCIEKVPSRFKLIVLAAQRAKELACGNPLTVTRDNDKNTVVALREIAEGLVDTYELEDKVIESIQNNGRKESEDIRGEENLHADLKLDNFNCFLEKNEFISDSFIEIKTEEEDPNEDK